MGYELPPKLQQPIALIFSDEDRGTGFLVAPDLVLTALHVVDTMDWFSVNATRSLGT